jgi:hypothetical protein
MIISITVFIFLLHGLGPIACSDLELILKLETLINLGRGDRLITRPTTMSHMDIVGKYLCLGLDSNLDTENGSGFKASDLYSGGAWFEFRLRHGLY